MSRQADDYRDRADDARARSQTSHSHEEGRLQLKRQKALNALAVVEDWLEGPEAIATVGTRSHSQRNSRSNNWLDTAYGENEGGSSA